MDWLILAVSIPICFSLGFLIGAIFATAGRKSKKRILPRNTRVRCEHFVGEWIAIPKEDFDALRDDE